jgi:hypothetical protein
MSRALMIYQSNHNYACLIQEDITIFPVGFWRNHREAKRIGIAQNVPTERALHLLFSLTINCSYGTENLFAV